MSQNRNYEQMFDQFAYYQQELHKRNQDKIRIGLKVNVLLPLVFLIIAFITEGSKFVFLILWIVSLFGISFYLLYVEYTDYKLVEKMKEFGVIGKEEDTALIGSQVAERMEELQDFEFFADVKELREGIASDIRTIRERIEEPKTQFVPTIEEKPIIEIEDLDDEEPDLEIETEETEEGGNEENE